uniref:non-specific serine/threonine protein kinase n=1 Tax=Arcella intermedia TaxID=1963864 RepID=A0A6B2L2P1_9EUKA
MEVISELGKGCFGVVYKGKCRGKIVAIKKLHQQDVSDLDEFKKEVQILTHLRHPNVVLFMGACTEAGKLAIVTEFLPMGDVHHVIHSRSKDNPLPLLKILLMAKDVAQGMNWLHLSKPPIVHRDLKPTNLLVDENWRVKICDFGLSAWQLNKTLQDSGVAPGTPLWMSPEVLKGRPLSEKADVYSFGIVLWEMITGKEPFEHHEDYEKFVDAICDHGERPEIPQDMHPSLQSLLQECWHDNQRKRPAFGEIIERIEQAILVTTIGDNAGIEIWKASFEGGAKEGGIGLAVPFSHFAVVFYKYIGEALSRDRNDVGYKALQALLVEKEAEVTLERWGLFCKWFAPINKSILKHLVQIITVPYFHGDISRKDSETLLSCFKKGSFLVRLSMTEPIDKSPFTISKVAGKGEITHQRVYVNDNHSGYFVTTKDKKGKKSKIESEGGIENLFKNKKVAKELNLITPCPGSRYSHIAQRKPDDGSNPYIDDQ